MLGKSRYIILVSLLAGSMINLQACSDDSNGNNNVVCTPECIDGCTCDNGTCKDADGNICDDNTDDQPATCDPECTDGCTCDDGTCKDADGNVCDDNTDEPAACDPECTDGCTCDNGTCKDADGNVCDDNTDDQPATCDPECTDGCTCDNGTCKDADGNVCEDEVHVPGCDPECTDDCTCVEGICKDADGNVCEDKPATCDPECAYGCTCDDGVCKNAAGNACAEPTAPECDPACTGGTVCYNNACVCPDGVTCSGMTCDTECTAPTVCDDTTGKCVCPEGVECPDLACDPACTGTATCVNGVCVCPEDDPNCVIEPQPTCDASCTAPALCLGGQCICPDGLNCDGTPAARVCEPACTDKFVCVNGVCECPAGETCVTVTPGCTGGTVSINGECVCPDDVTCSGMTCDTECVSPSICDDKTGKCVCPEGSECPELACEPACPETASCINGICVCSEDNPGCMPTCDINCTAPAACINGECVCPDEANCDGTPAARVCSPECEGEYTCVNGECVCPDGVNCDGTIEPPVDPPIVVECDPACTGKYICLEGTCVCPDGEVCDETPAEPEDDSWMYITGSCLYVDSDGDFISDLIEGRASKVDSDGDGTPDYLDTDSDNDGVPDSVEAETRGCSGEDPRDRDADGIPNYLDDDSDGNGILDGVEIGDINNPLDTDGDTLPDYLDKDNDGDTIQDKYEIYGSVAPGASESSTTFAGDCNKDGKADNRGTSNSPIDCDNDGKPDYMDTDTDNDGIPDVEEAHIYFNNQYIRYTDDADKNGIKDGTEGYGDIDGDNVPNHLDLDNDNDGLSDADEIKYGSNPNLSDSDGDDANDLVEWAAGTDPNNKKENPVSEGNFVFVVPYKDTTSPKKQTLSFVTGIQMIDLYFSFDSSGSMIEEFKTLGNNINSMLESMRCTDYGKTCLENSECSEFSDSICSEAGRCISNPTAGNGCFADMWTGFGTWGDVNTFMNRQSLSNNSAPIVETLNKFTQDWKYTQYSFNYQGTSENSVQPAICAVFGGTYCSNPVQGTFVKQKTFPLGCYNGSDTNRFGCVGFRKNAIKVYIQANDESNVGSTLTYNGNTNAWTTTGATNKWGGLLKENKIRFVSLYSSSGYSGPREMARAAGSCAQADCSSVANSALYVTTITDTNLNTKAVEMIREIAKNMPIQITSTVEDIDVSGVKNLVEKLDVVVQPAGASAQGRVCQPISNTIITGKYQGIQDLKPGVVVCYDVHALNKQSLFPATREPQLLKARIKVMGDGSVLNSGIAYFVVPPDLSNNFAN